MKAITNATIFCPEQGLITKGTILFDEKKIHAVGENIQIPEEVELVDGTGK
jgi:imidazolonepropionase-like amidohydrolase